MLNPPYVFGPGIQEINSPEALNTSLSEWYSKVILGQNLETAATQGSSWIDVRDLSIAHVKAIENEEAGGERIIVAKGPFIWQNWVETANNLASSLPEVKLPKGYPDKAKNAPFPVSYDTSKAKKLLQMHYRDKEDTARDVLQFFAAKGWLQQA